MQNSSFSYDKVYKLDNVFGFWYYNNYLRVAYVSKGWLTVWDHRQDPPTRYDCKDRDHNLACGIAIDRIRELA